MRNTLLVSTSALLLTGCAGAPAAGATLLIFAAALLWARPARSGAPAPPPPCAGEEYFSCERNRLTRHCTDKGKKAPKIADFVNCGYDSCVPGRDRGMCKPWTAVTTGAKDAASCGESYGDWQKACVDNRITEACIMSVPTNYMGPPRNPHWLECPNVADRCAPPSEPEQCLDKRGAVKTCAGTWEKVCLRGKIEERCVPPKITWGGKNLVRAFAECSPTTCAIGSEDNCPGAKPKKK